MRDFADIAILVARALESVGIEYFLGGSMASSVQGEPRATNDIDFVVAMTEAQVPAFVKALGSDFEVDEEALRDAARRRESWNIYYLPLLTKVDLFVLRSAPFDQSEFARRQAIELTQGQRIVVKSAEDSVLRKLLWFQETGWTTQWRDVVQVLRVSKPQLNDAYLDDWAGQLGIRELLDRARQEASI